MHAQLEGASAKAQCFCACQKAAMAWDSNRGMPQLLASLDRGSTAGTVYSWVTWSYVYRPSLWVAPRVVLGKSGSAPKVTKSTAGAVQAAEISQEMDLVGCRNCLLVEKRKTVRVYYHYWPHVRPDKSSFNI